METEMRIKRADKRGSQLPFFLYDRMHSFDEPKGSVWGGILWGPFLLTKGEGCRIIGAIEIEVRDIHSVPIAPASMAAVGTEFLKHGYKTAVIDHHSRS